MWDFDGLSDAEEGRVQAAGHEHVSVPEHHACVEIQPEAAENCCARVEDEACSQSGAAESCVAATAADVVNTPSASMAGSAPVADTTKFSPSAACTDGPQVDRAARPTEEPLIYTDADGVPRGACSGCHKCPSWLVQDFQFIEFILDGEFTPEDRKYTYDRKMRGYNDKRKHGGTKCERCGCLAQAHESLDPWRVAVMKRIRHLRQRLTDPGVTDKNEKYEVLSNKRRVPRQARMPSAALKWDELDVAFFLVSMGVYDPRFDGRPKVAQCPTAESEGICISVVCPTSDKRHVFHPLLYENFRGQTYEPKELIVVDSGKSPSKFFKERAQEDPRVVYRFFPVADSKETDPMAAVVCNEGRTTYTLEDVKRRKGLKFTPQRGWSLGLKRNIACYLARGSAIAHFDDDDLYAPCYLSRMCESLLAAEGEGRKPWCPRPGSGGLRPAVAKLCEWHMVDLQDAEFGYFNPKTDALLEAHRRESIRYGFGFSYVYTRAAWELVAFPDVEFSEDGEFITILQGKAVPVKLVASQGPQDGLAAHTHHSESTSGGEMVGQVRLGEGVAVPDSFKSLLPVYRKVATLSGIRRGAAHPIRQEMSKVLDGKAAPAEIGWRRKEDFLASNPNFGKQPKPEELRKAQHPAWPPRPPWPKGKHFPGGVGVAFPPGKR